MEENSLTKKEKYILSIIFILFVLVSTFAISFFRKPFVDELTIEAGSSLKLEDLLKRDAVEPKFITTIDEELLSTVGSHKIKLGANYTDYQVTLNIQDTIAPKAKVSNKTMWIGDDITSDLFVSEIEDATQVTSTFKTTPDFNKEGKQDVTIVLTDDGGNQTEYKAKLTLKKDTTAPQISVVNTIMSNKGDSILYKKNAEVTDNRDETVTLNIDSSKVNINKPGTYTAIYSATDKAGNKATKEVKVIILSQNDSQLKEEAQKLAKKLIDELTDEDMTKQEKLEKCFYYIHKNIQYNGLHEGSIENYHVDALTGLKTLKGDCLVSNGVLRVVCEVLDVPTMVVVRTSQKKTNHYWFLANTGDGWYHYDGFKRKNVTIYRWTDEKLLTWSKANDDLAEFDTLKYPSTPKE